MGRVTGAAALRRFAEVRLGRVPAVVGVSAADHALYAEVTASCVEDAWPALEESIGEPFLAPAENAEMLRRLPWLAMEVAARVLGRFLHVAASAAARGTFTAAANTTRLAAKLRLELQGELEVHELRRVSVEEVRAGRCSLEATRSLFLRENAGLRVELQGDPVLAADTRSQRVRLASSNPAPPPLQELRAELETLLYGARIITPRKPPAAPPPEARRSGPSPSIRARGARMQASSSSSALLLLAAAEERAPAAAGDQDVRRSRLPRVRSNSWPSHAGAIKPALDTETAAAPRPGSASRADRRLLQSGPAFWSAIPDSAPPPPAPPLPGVDVAREQHLARLAALRADNAQALQTCLARTRLNDPDGQLELDPLLQAISVHIPAAPAERTPTRQQPPKRYLRSDSSLEQRDALTLASEQELAASRLAVDPIPRQISAPTLAVRLSARAHLKLQNYRVSDRVPKPILVLTPVDTLFQEFGHQVAQNEKGGKKRKRREKKSDRKIRNSFQ